MLRVFFRVFLTNILRHKMIAIINLFGLTVGLTAFLLLSLYVQNEYSWDRHWPNADRLVRLTYNDSRSGFGYPMATGPAVAMTQLLDHFPDEIEAGSRRVNFRDQLVDINGEKFSGFFSYVDQSFADLFSLEAVHGSLLSTLEAPYRVALTVDDAKKYFGTVDVLGKQITLTGKDGLLRVFTITAVFRLPEGNSMQYINSFTLLHEGAETGVGEKISSWQYPVEYTSHIFLLNEGVDIEAINSRLDDFVDLNVGRGSEVIKPSESIQLRLQKLTDIHLDPLPGESGGDVRKVGIFVAVALLVLLIGIINYLTLATAQSSDRKREIGVKKAAGASNSELLLAFVAESLLYTFIAMILALCLAELVLPAFSNFAAQKITLDYGSFSTIGFLVFIMLIVGVLGGSYPGFILSRFRPEKVLRSGNVYTVSGSLSLRNFLLVFQFSIAIALMLASLLIYVQLDFVHNHDPGFQPENIASITGFNSGLGQDKASILQTEICQLPQVEVCSLANRWVNSMAGMYSMSYLLRTQSDENIIESDNVGIGYEFFSLYKIPLLAGRSFDPAIEMLQIENGQLVDIQGAAITATRLVLNETAIKALGYENPEAAIGQIIYNKVTGTDGISAYPVREIIGVVADNQLLSLRKRPVPLAYSLVRPQYSFFIQVRLAHGSEAVFTADVERIWTQVLGLGKPYIEFAENNVNSAFAIEEKEGLLLMIFAGLAILVSCLGLYGVVAFETKRRVKEIGIRKVLGSEVKSIVALFVWQFSKPVLLANLIAWPVAVWAMLQWLQRFPYRIDSWVFLPLCLAAGFLAWLIAVLTVSTTSSNAASLRPVASLRYE